MLQNISFTLSEGIEKIKTEKIRKKSEGRRGDSGWSGSIVFWPSPPPPLHRTNMAGQKASLQAKNGRALQDIARKGYTWKAHQRRTGVCKLPQFTAQMNQSRGIQVRFVE